MGDTDSKNTTVFTKCLIKLIIIMKETFLVFQGHCIGKEETLMVTCHFFLDVYKDLAPTASGQTVFEANIVQVMNREGKGSSGSTTN